MIYEFSDIDLPSSNNPITRGAEADYFSLFEFSAKYDPVPTMLTQNPRINRERIYGPNNWI